MNYFTSKCFTANYIIWIYFSKNNFNCDYFTWNYFCCYFSWYEFTSLTVVRTLTDQVYNLQLCSATYPSWFWCCKEQNYSTPSAQSDIEDTKLDLLFVVIWAISHFCGFIFLPKRLIWSTKTHTQNVKGKCSRVV